MKISQYIFQYFLLLSLLAFSQHNFLFAQQGIQLSMSPKLSFSQWQQPAHLATDPFEKYSLGIGGAFALAGNQVPIGDWPLYDNFLDEPKKEAILAELDTDNRFNILGQAELLFLFRSKKRPVSIGFRQRSLAHTSFQNPNTLGLVLKGNAAYAGQVIEDPEIRLTIQAYSELSAGTAATKGNWSYGGRVKFLLGNNYQALDMQNFSLSTSETGTRIQVAANYEYDRSMGKSLDGFGVAADLGVSYEVNEKLQLQASVIDLGFISWQVDKVQNILDTSYEGLLIENISELDLSTEESIFSSDSLQRLFLPDSSQINSTVYVPGFAQMGVNYQLTERSSLGLLVRYGFKRESPMSNNIQANLIFQHHINSWLKGGLHGSIGGLSGFDAGVFLAGNIALSKKRDLQIFWQSDQILGLIQPQFGKAQAMQAGIIFKH